jgi:hypothetical protein
MRLRTDNDLRYGGTMSSTSACKKEHRSAFKNETLVRKFQKRDNTRHRFYLRNKKESRLEISETDTEEELVTVAPDATSLPFDEPNDVQEIDWVILDDAQTAQTPGFMKRLLWWFSSTRDRGTFHR